MCEVTIYLSVKRNDKGEISSTILLVNETLVQLKIKAVDNSKISDHHLSKL